MTTMTWCQTSLGNRWDFAAPDPDSVNWAEIAHAMSNTCRFGGHTRVFYSVAEHCCRVHDWLKEKGAPMSARLVGLLHDAHEAYIGDIPTPLANVLGCEAIKALKEQHDRAIFKAANLPFPWSDETTQWVKRADAVFLMSERDALLGPGSEPWPDGLEDIERTDVNAPGWFPQAAARNWLDRLTKYGYGVELKGK